MRVAGTEAVALANDVAFGADDTMYVSDTAGGAVWRVPAGGAAEAWVSDPLLTGDGEAGFGLPLGANGIHVAGDSVYVGVTETAQVVAVPINEDGSAGTPATWAQLPAAIDDVAVDEREGSIFAIVNQFNAAVDLLTDPDERLELAELNLAAGVRAKHTAAYGSAYTYLTEG